jgi:hypothetical protein
MLKLRSFHIFEVANLPFLVEEHTIEPFYLIGFMIFTHLLVSFRNRPIHQLTGHQYFIFNTSHSFITQLNRFSDRSHVEETPIVTPHPVRIMN